MYLWHHNITNYKATTRNKVIAKKQKQKLFYTFVNQKKRHTTMLKRTRTILILAATILAVGCSRSTAPTEPTIWVTITPLKALAEELTMGDFRVECLVPAGASPESFEPTARQIASLNDAELLFSVGLIEFEHDLTANISDDRLINLSEGITTLEGSCSHHHGHHSHGVDPHIWTAPRTLGQMVDNMHRALKQRYPDSVKYDTAANRLLERIDSLDSYCRACIDSSKLRAMMIYHPAYTYFAHDYDIEQIAIEHDGKEPTPKQLTTLSERAASLNIGAILIQPQYNADKVRPIAEQIDVEIITTNPLAEDIEGEIRRITEIICRDNE